MNCELQDKGMNHNQLFLQWNVPKEQITYGAQVFLILKLSDLDQVLVDL